MQSAIRQFLGHCPQNADASHQIVMGDTDYDYSVLGDDLDPDDLYDEMTQYTAKIAKLPPLLPPTKWAVIKTHMLDILCKMVFGSNNIETAGGGINTTTDLCQPFFLGKSLPVIETIDEKAPDYKALKRHLINKNMPADAISVLRSHREITQHAQAARHILVATFLDGKDLSEKLILETHRILTHGIDTEQGYSWTQYSGVYRQVPVAAGLHGFPPPEQVPSLMRKLIKSFRADLEDAAKTGKMDPVVLAAKYCHKFVNIHPFLDGNGRMCRLVLNALLLKYAGFVVCLGLDEEAKDKYLEIASAVSMAETGGGCGDWDEDDPDGPKCYKGLASFVLKGAVEGLRGFCDLLEGEECDGGKV
ncbi:fido domain-containing protein [Cercophora scortea]|uniref:Fido domain-containing protein n=1 Tax=Cercophora scortea TaxID=314031 RepID=A0AAE0M6P7_9PEZI|nr:fido domain-containing protein [Cercophora scortea]